MATCISLKALEMSLVWFRILRGVSEPRWRTASSSRPLFYIGHGCSLRRDEKHESVGNIVLKQFQSTLGREKPQFMVRLGQVKP